jgi:hypothetical protein
MTKKEALIKVFTSPIVGKDQSMTKKEAVQILGKNQPKWALRNMSKALNMCKWMNTPEEARLLKALCALGYGRKKELDK